jgi:hypothetical protein
MKHVAAGDNARKRVEGMMHMYMWKGEIDEADSD